MLLGVKIIRDTDKAIGRTMGKFYNWIAPDKAIRRQIKYSNERIESHNQEFKANNPNLYKEIKEACDELGEQVPPILDHHSFTMDLNCGLAVPIEFAKTISKEHLRYVVSHELGHLDTNRLGVKLGNLATKVWITAFFATVFINSEICKPIFYWSLVAAFITNSYLRSEEFRCDKKSLQPNGSKLLEENLVLDANHSVRKYGDLFEIAQSLFSTIHSFIELFISYPTNWARKENLREAERELEKQKAASLA